MVLRFSWLMVRILACARLGALSSTVVFTHNMCLCSPDGYSIGGRVCLCVSAYSEAPNLRGGFRK